MYFFCYIATSYKLAGARAAAKSPAGAYNSGIVTFVTTGNTIIGQDVLRYASKHGVKVFQSVAFEYKKSGRVTFSPAVRLNTDIRNPSFTVPLFSWPSKLKF